MAFQALTRAGRFILTVTLFILLAAACMPEPGEFATPAGLLDETAAPTAAPPLPSPSRTPPPLPTEPPAPSLTPTPTPLIPAFAHVVIIVFENKEFTTVINNPEMPVFNRLAQEFTLLGQHYAILHPSLPNYIAMIGGNTFGIATNYPDVVIDAPSLPDYIELSGRDWKSYQESMPEPCYLQDTLSYVQKHNPFIFFRPIRENTERCRAHVVPLEELERDLQQGALPDFVFITPNLCHSAHDSYTRPEECGMRVVDHWLAGWMERLLSYPGLLEDGVIILTWDEGQGEHTCCGLETGGGRIPTVLVSKRVKPGFLDPTPYTHYSLLRTIAEAWTLPAPGYAADNEKAPLIVAPWQ
ncbi:MAG: hypothetical protein HPY59_19365 [Anaerolineae bacterium]|nr:hypothetical protein [Anaerolineae bacterium]